MMFLITQRVTQHHNYHQLHHHCYHLQVAPSCYGWHWDLWGWIIADT